MHDLILWAGFLGAWLLVAGPLHQASVELRGEELERDRFAPVMAALDPPPKVSARWWLVPPLRLYLGHRAKERWQRLVWLSLPDEEFEALNSFMAKARGWLYVGAGGLLIAVKETWELVEGHEWPVWSFWALVVGMAALAVANVALQSARASGLAEQRTQQHTDSPG